MDTTLLSVFVLLCYVLLSLSGFTVRHHRDEKRHWESKCWWMQNHLFVDDGDICATVDYKRSLGSLRAAVFGGLPLPRCRETACCRSLQAR